MSVPLNISHLQGDIIKVTINDHDQNQDFFLHKDLLSERSPCFAALPNFKEGNDGAVILNDMNVAGFRCVLHWMHTSSVPGDTESSGVLVHAYVIADRLLLGTCKNMVIDKMKTMYRAMQLTPELPQMQDLMLLEELGYTASCSLAQLLIHVAQGDLMDLDGTGLGETMQELAKEVRSEKPALMVHELILALLCHPSGGLTESYYCREPPQLPYAMVDDPPSAAVKCSFHEHEEGERCYLEEETGSEATQHTGTDTV